MEGCSPRHSSRHLRQLLLIRQLCEGESQEHVRRKRGVGSATQRRQLLALGQLPGESVGCGAEIDATRASIEGTLQDD